jgi:uncharacterized protein (DUF2342 family)
MSRYVAVTYDEARDFAYVQYQPVTLATDADVAAFAEEIDVAMTKLGRKVDIIVDLGELCVKPSTVTIYDETRQRLIRTYARRAYRYSGGNLVRTKILTSSTLHGQNANVFQSFAQALEALLADRARDTGTEMSER